MNPERRDQHERMQSIRKEYELRVSQLTEQISAMRREGKTVEEIAKTVHGLRCELAKRYKELTPEPFRARLYRRTLEKYGDRNGPTISFLQDRGKTWEQILESAARPGKI